MDNFPVREGWTPFNTDSMAETQTAWYEPNGVTCASRWVGRVGETAYIAWFYSEQRQFTTAEDAMLWVEAAYLLTR